MLLGLEMPVQAYPRSESDLLDDLSSNKVYSGLSKIQRLSANNPRGPIENNPMAISDSTIPSISSTSTKNSLLDQLIDHRFKLSQKISY